MSRGYVYVLSNPAMPGLVKIGRTIHNPEDRARQLDNTGVPMPFVLEFSCLSPNCHELEQWAHEHLDRNRVRLEREFFRVDAKEAALAIGDLLQEQVAELVEEYLPGCIVISDSEHADLIEMAAQSPVRSHG